MRSISLALLALVFMSAQKAEASPQVPPHPVAAPPSSSTVAGDTPSCISWSANRFDCFVRGTDRAMYHAWWDGQWKGWENLAGELSSKPSCVSWGPNRIDCIARSVDDAMWHKWFDGQKWNGWENLGGVFATANPTCVSWGPNRLDCFARGNDGAMYTNSWNGNQWGHWGSIGGVFSTADPTCVSWGAHRLDCFARGNDNVLYHQWWNGNQWNRVWEPLGGILTSNPSCVSWGANRLDCFARGTDGALFQRAWNGTKWLEWKSVGGQLSTADPSCVSWGPNRIDCLARFTDGAMYHAWGDGNVWLGWEPLRGILTSNPTCGSWGATRVDCFAQTTDGATIHKWFDGNQWRGWEALGLLILDPSGAHCKPFTRPHLFPKVPDYTTQTILETTYRNPPPTPSINLSSKTWARDVVHGRGMYDISSSDAYGACAACPLAPIVGEFSSHGYSQNEWTQILKPDQDIEYGLVGLSGRAIIFDGDDNIGKSGADVPFTHPFGTDWEFYIAPDAAYQKLAAPPAPPPDQHCEYAESVIEAKRDFSLDVLNTLGVETDERLLPVPYRPHHGDRVAVWGRWIVDTGHPDFHTEIHPPLLLATARATTPDETTTTVIGRPYLVGQRWNDCGPLTCTSHGLMDHILDEADKVPIRSQTMEAHPNILPKAWYGSFLVNYTVKPPTPRIHPSDRLMVSFHFTVWTGVVVQLSNVGDAAVLVTIKMREGNLSRDVTKPPAQQYFVTVEDLEALNQAEAEKLNVLNATVHKKLDILTMGIGRSILAKGIKTTRYLGPNAPPTSFHTTQVPVKSLDNSPYYAIDDNQPWPIFGTLTLTWERGF